MSFGTCEGCNSYSFCPLATRYVAGREVTNKACSGWQPVQEPIPYREQRKVTIKSDKKGEIVLSQK